MQTIGTESVFILYHYFHPDDVVSARLFSDLAQAITAEGAAVVAMPAVRSCHDGEAAFPTRQSWLDVQINRVWRPAWKQASNKGRIGNAIFMLAGWTWRALIMKRKNREIMIVGTDPIMSILVTIPWRLFRPHAAIIHWCHDVYPQAAVADDLLRSDSLIVRQLNSLLKIAYRRCDVLIDLGPCMRNVLAAASGTSPSTPHSTEERQPDGSLAVRRLTITPWSLVEPDQVPTSDEEVRQELFGSARLGLLYSGNLGRAHIFSSFLNLARQLRQLELAGDKPRTLSNISLNSNLTECMTGDGTAPRVGLCFAGRGPRMEELRSQTRDTDVNLRFAGFAVEGELEQRLAAADIHLVSLQPSWTGTVVPSKFFGALAVGRPVLFSGSESSAIAKWIREFQVGWVLNDENLDAVACQIYHLSQDVRQLQSLQQHCFDVYHTEFSKSVQLRKWTNLVQYCSQEIGRSK